MSGRFTLGDAKNLVTGISEKITVTSRNTAAQTRNRDSSRMFASLCRNLKIGSQLPPIGEIAIRFPELRGDDHPVPDQINDQRNQNLSKIFRIQIVHRAVEFHHIL